MALPEHRAARLLAIRRGACLRGGRRLARPAALGAVLFATFAIGLFLTIFDPDHGGAVTRFANAMVAALYVGFLLPHVVSLRLLRAGRAGCSSPSRARWAPTRAPYFAGRFTGRTQAHAPRQSRTRPVEGAIGGLLGERGPAPFAWMVLPPAWRTP